MRAVDLIVAKRDGHELSADELDWLVQGLTRGDLPDYQLAAWLMAVYFQGMTPAETSNLTRSMVASGRRLDLSSLGSFVGDKHSTGGVGDKTSLVVAPLVVAAGMPIAKMSGHGLGFSGGTLDKLQSIPGFRTELSIEEFIEGARKVGLVIASQSPDMAPADGLLYALRDVTGTVESLPLIASSIMSKKIAAGANGVVLDVKVGRGAFMKTEADARALAVAMLDIGESVGLKVCAVLSSMDQPLGNAVGNILEVREAIDTLRGHGPADLLQVAFALGAKLLQMGGKVDSIEEGKALLEYVLNSGAGLKKFREFVANQGGDPDYIDNPERFPEAPYALDVTAPQAGYLTSIDAEIIGHASVEIGAGRKFKGDAIDYRVGFVLHAKLGDLISHGQPLATIHARNEASARAITPELIRAFEIGAEAIDVPPVILGVVA